MVKNKQTPKGQLAKQRDTLGFQSGMRERESEKKTKTYLVNQYIYILCFILCRRDHKSIYYIFLVHGRLIIAFVKWVVVFCQTREFHERMRENPVKILLRKYQPSQDMIETHPFHSLSLESYLYYINK